MTNNTTKLCLNAVYLTLILIWAELAGRPYWHIMEYGRPVAVQPVSK